MKLFYFISILFCSCFLSQAQVFVHSNAHSHNDYKQAKPLLNALENGFNSVEADVFLINKKLIVSHTYPLFGRKKTLEELYLKPLQQIILRNNGKVYESSTQPLILLIDIKQNANKTYFQLQLLLEKYKQILTSYENGFIVKRAVTVVLSGHKPIDLLMNEKIRYCFIDQNITSIKEGDDNAMLYPLASCNYSSIISWNGKGGFADSEKLKLKNYVSLAHRQGKMVRLWASPENEKVWNALIECEVDLINTNELEKLNRFLKDRKP